MITIFQELVNLIFTFIIDNNLISDIKIDPDIIVSTDLNQDCILFIIKYFIDEHNQPSTSNVMTNIPDYNKHGNLYCSIKVFQNMTLIFILIKVKIYIIYR